MSRYKEFLKNFEKSVLSAKRAIEEIELIAVSKRKTPLDILTVLQEGHLSYGENQLQEVKKNGLNYVYNIKIQNYILLVQHKVKKLSI